MKRAALVGVGTLAGVAAVLALNPDQGTTSAASSTATSSGTSSGTTAGSSSSGSSSSGSSGSGSSGSTSSGSSSSGSTASGSSGTYIGDAVDIGHNYGIIQLEVTVENGTVTAITAVQTPENDPRSAQINAYAVPQLVSQALDSQSASVAGISGATFTSNGFAQSLASALAQAGLS